MYIKKILGSMTFLLIISYAAHAQQNNPADLPLIVPPSPEVSTLIKTSLLGNDLHTGAATANVNLFEITNGPIKFPISLSYRSNGIKVNDIPSRVGIGWSLNANGVVSRTVRDEEDDRVGRQWQSPPSFSPTSTNTAMYNFMKESRYMYYDSENDEYSFSVNGYSGNFFIDTAGVPREVRHSNISITKDSTTSFIIRTPDGIRYFFGGSGGLIERTKSFQSNGSGAHTRPIKTAWFLYKIQSPENHIINFNYDSLVSKAFHGYFQSVVLKIPGSSNSGCSNCEIFCPERFPQTQSNLAEYYTKYLTSITTSNGIKVEFNYEDRNDLSGDNRLEELLILYEGYSGDTLIKKYAFEYEEYGSDSLKNKRFYLKKIKEVTDSPSLDYEFEYDDPEYLPDQTSLSQDYFGYANGAANSVNFFPKPLNPSQFTNGSLGADRTPNFDYAKKGSLKKIKYPTGGEQEFTYEPHTLPEQAYDTAYGSPAHLHGTSYQTPGSQTKVYTSNVTTGDVGKIKVFFSIYWDPNSPCYSNPGGSGCYFAGSHIRGKLKISKTSDGQVVYQRSHNDSTNYSIIEWAHDVEPNTAYTVELTMEKWGWYGDMYVYYAPSLTAYWNNVPVCGIRVKQIDNIEPVSNDTTHKYYTYASLSDLQKSSGIGSGMTDFQQQYISGGYCDFQAIGCTQGIELIQCQNLHQFSSSSLSSDANFNGSPVAYSHIIESEDEQKEKGGIETEFVTFYDNSYEHVWGYSMPGVPAPEQSTIPNGTMVAQHYFKKKPDQSYSIIKEINYEYSIDSRWDHYADNYMVRERWDGGNYSPPYSDLALILSPYDVARYRYSSFWLHLDKKEVKTYFDNDTLPLIETINYEYNNLVSLEPTRITMLNSRGDTIEQLLTYPSDYLPSEPYQTMINEGVRIPVIQMTRNKITGVTTTPLDTVKTNYSSFGNLEKPASVQTTIAGAGSLQTRVTFNVYDTTGKIREQQKADDVKEVYLWGYKSSYPVAKILNTTYAIAAGYITQSVLDNPPDDATLRSHLDTLRNIAGAFVTTYTYNPLVGMTSQTDATGRTVYYEYDKFGRLILVKDEDGNILKRIDYKYKGTYQD